MEKRRFRPLILALICLSGCYRIGGETMSRNEFLEVQMGDSVKALEKKYGKPYSINSREGDTMVYEYIEKIYMGTTTISQRRYYFIVLNDRIVGKYVKIDNPPAFNQIYSDDPYPNY